MSDLKLFHLADKTAKEIQGTTHQFEKRLQSIIEGNLSPLLGIRFLVTEYPTGKTHGGRIDTLGLDENNSPVIIEYKRSVHENIINQGLFYLDWLMDHQAEFKLLVLEKFGKSIADDIDWSAPRLLCIAADFTKYDSHAVEQMDRNIELLRYRQFGKELLLLELVNVAASEEPRTNRRRSTRGGGKDKPVAEWLRELSPQVRQTFDSLERFLNSLGDDVQRKDLKLYIAFKRLRNFATVCFQKNNLLVYLHVNPDQAGLEDGFSRDVRKVGHWGTGDLEVTLKNEDDLEKALILIERAYHGGNHAK